MHSGELSRYLVIGFVVLSMAVMGYILYALDSAKEHFATETIEQSASRVRTELDQFFLPVEQLIRSLERQSSLGLFEESDLSELNRFYIPLIERFPQLSSVGIADGRGYELDILPAPETSRWHTREVFADEWGAIERWTEWRANPAISRTDSWERSLAVDPRDRPWFRGALRSPEDELYWTAPYRFTTNQELGVTVSMRWATEASTGLDQLLALDITLQDITRFTQSLSITDNNQIYILTRGSREIIGLPADARELTELDLPDVLLSTPEEFGSEPLVALLSRPEDRVVSFKNGGEMWWGLLQRYSISSSQELLYAILIPERDFAGEIHRTRNAAIAGFLIILGLTLLLARSHNSLEKARNSVNKKNDVILQQKERLFAEVHHRVKNNLAVMSALMDLEQGESGSPEAREVLAKMQRRVKSMAAVHEIMYRSDDLNRVKLSEFLPGILAFAHRDLADQQAEVEQELDDVLINVNQALTYALLVNELMSALYRSGLPSSDCIRIEVRQHEMKMQTDLQIRCPWDPEHFSRDHGSPLIGVLLQQLRAGMDRVKEENGYRLTITFELVDTRGVAGNMAANQL